MRLKSRHCIFAASLLFLLFFSCGKQPVPVLKVVDTENKKLIVLSGERTIPVNIYDADFVILGGGLGGIAAALSICSAGRTALLVEETSRIAGCFALQDTSFFIENNFIETSGSSPAYQTFRLKILEWYEKNALSPPELNSGLFGDIDDFGSNCFCFETKAALDVINEMLEKNIERGKLTVIKRHKIAKIITFYNRISSLIAVDMDNLVCNHFTGWMFIDATRTGYIQPFADVRHIRGRESRADTGEPHAPENPDPFIADEFLYCSDVLPPEDSEDFRECYVLDLYTEEPKSSGETLNIPVDTRPRRMETLRRIVEQDISAEFQDGPRAEFFKDSVGIGYFSLYLSSDNERAENLIIETLPFQIPLGALIPVQYTNLFAGGRTLGASYIAARAYHNPSIEWAVGEAAGEAAAYCAGYKIYSHELANNPVHVRGLQDWLVTKRGVPIYWYDDVKSGDPDFAEAQFKPFDESGYHSSRTTLHYRE